MKLDIEIFDEWGVGTNSPCRFLVHGSHDILWTNSPSAAAKYLLTELEYVTPKPKTDPLIKIQEAIKAKQADIEAVRTLLDANYGQLGALLDDFYNPARWANGPVTLR